mmetsp:Transcript_7140/g.10561  ORF Transcript_7140/g.10561 Transcript_7140/m.10561 type:complete len:461 (-) Transcript_7140:120-1502(-)
MSSKLDYLSKYGSSKKKRKKKSKSTRVYDEDANDYSEPVISQHDEGDEEGPTVVLADGTAFVDQHKSSGKFKSDKAEGDAWRVDKKKKSKGRRKRSRRYDSDDDDGERGSGRSSGTRYDSDDAQLTNINKKSRTSNDRSWRPDSDEESISRGRRKRYDSDDQQTENKMKTSRKRYDSDDEDDFRAQNRKRFESDDNGEGDSDDLKNKRSTCDSDDFEDEGSGSKSGRKHSNQDVKPKASRQNTHNDKMKKEAGKRRVRYDSDDEKIESSKSKSAQRQKMTSGHIAGLQSSSDFQSAEQKIKQKNMIDTQSLNRGETVYRSKDGKSVQVSSHSSHGDRDEIENPADLNVGAVQRQRAMDLSIQKQIMSQSTFARSVDDADQWRRSRIREGDPMAKRDSARGESSKKTYKGPQPKANRFGIGPGYRFDGIDRGNGFEDKVLAVLYGKGRKKEEAYKWSCADM